MAGSRNSVHPTRVACLLLILAAAAGVLAEEPTQAATAAFDNYVSAVESRLEQQHRGEKSFLAAAAPGDPELARLQRGELIITRVEPASASDLPGAMLHHWRGTAFVRGGRAADFERLLMNFEAYPQIYSPEVVRARVLARRGDQFQVVMRVRQQHIITVVMDMTYGIEFERFDAQHGYNLSRSTKIAEIDAPGTPSERAVSGSAEHGFLWRLNTYWSYEERDGGLYMQIESVSLSRSIPRGLGWAIGPFVESVPRESLEFTLRSTCNALRK